MKSLRIGLCGVGNVGGAVLKTLTSSSELLKIQGGVQFDLVQVGARKGKKAVPFDGIEVSTNLREVATNPEIDVFVELIGGVDLAYELVTDAINSGKHIVTANKALISKFGNDLFTQAKKNNVEIGFELLISKHIQIFIRDVRIFNYAATRQVIPRKHFLRNNENVH